MNTQVQTLNLSIDDQVMQSGSRASRFARSQLTKRLAGLQGGRLLVTDCWGEWSVGDGEETHRLTVHNPQFYVDVALGGSLGAGASYIEGAWSCPALTQLLRLFIKNEQLTDKLDGGVAVVAAGINWLRHRLSVNSRKGSARNIHAHYDMGNDFFSLFLDPTMTYSCGIFADESTTLEQASVEKLDRVCRKLALNSNHHVLEIGTGWGSFSIHAASQYGCRVTTTTISQEQHDLAAQRIQAAGLADKIEVLMTDYRDLQGQYDRLVSIEMIEAVGHEFLPRFFSKCANLLTENGAMLMQGITMPDNRYAQYLRSSDFIRAYVFPGSCCPALSALQNAIGTASDLKTVHLEDIGPHYATTLARWREQFLKNQEAILALGYPPRLLRLWDYYLCYCEAGFSERYIGNVQMLLHKPACRMNLSAAAHEWVAP